MSLLIIKPCIFINWPKDSRTTSIFASGFDFLGPKLYFFFLFILVFGALHAKMPLNWWVAGACTIPQSTETIKIVIKMLYAGWWPLVLAFHPPRPFVRSSFRRLSPVDLDSADKSKRLLNVSTMGTTSAAATNWWTKDCAGSKYRPQPIHLLPLSLPFSTNPTRPRWQIFFGEGCAEQIFAISFMLFKWQASAHCDWPAMAKKQATKLTCIYVHSFALKEKIYRN